MVVEGVVVPADGVMLGIRDLLAMRCIIGDSRDAAGIAGAGGFGRRNAIGGVIPPGVWYCRIMLTTGRG